MASSLSLAQVEEELRAAEAYLTAGASTQAAAAGSNAEVASENGGRTRAVFDKPRVRPVLSEERRKEILAKLSTERQAAMRSRRNDVAPVFPTDGSMFEPGVSEPSVAGGVALGEYSEDSPGRRSSVVSDRTSEGSVELFYASDVLGSPSGAQMSSLSRILSSDPGAYEPFIETHLLSESRRDEMASDSGLEEETDRYQQASVYSNLFHSSNEHHVVEKSPVTSLSSRIDGHIWHTEREDDPRSDAQTRNERKKPSVWWDPSLPEPATEIPHTSQHEEYKNFVPSSLGWSRTNPMSRLDKLAQPRLDLFVDCEKRRLQQEVESLRECTFKPNLTKERVPRTSGTGSNPASKHEIILPGYRASNSGAFPWLTLSPRQKGSGKNSQRRMSLDGHIRSQHQSVIERLHLDGTLRYEQRERAKEILEAERLRSCTFKPAINPTSRSLAFAVNYKPIHHRLSDMQRAREEQLQRVRERLAREEDGGTPFAPRINPKSREIVESTLSDCDSTKPQSKLVTERLAEDAQHQLERRSAIQEYYDEVNQQPFAPVISEKSEEIIKQRPEFQQLDFVTRQDYFKTLEQEKREALEDFCDGGQVAPFKPDIGNADAILQHLRPDLVNETQEEKLYRLIYRGPKNLELKKQKLREQEYSKCTFKPDINPVSKVLGRSSTIDQLARPVTEFASPDDSVDTKREKKPEGAVSSREMLKKYFAGKRFRSKVALEMEQAERAECTFQPTLIASYKPRGMCSSASTSKLDSKSRGENVWKSDNLLHLIDERRQRKEQQMEAKRSELAVREMQECTFHPNVRKLSGKSSAERHADGTKKTRRKSSSSSSPSPPKQESDKNDQKPVIVRGLGRFLELRDLAKKQQAEKRQREQRAFQPNTAYEPRSYTVPKPFKLSESSRDSIRRRLRMKEEMSAKEREECTFQPKTLEAQRRKVLQHMLNR